MKEEMKLPDGIWNEAKVGLEVTALETIVISSDDGKTAMETVTAGKRYRLTDVRWPGPVLFFVGNLNVSNRIEGDYLKMFKLCTHTGSSTKR